jgi:predicted Ser/Thr protein kinase
MNNPYKHIYFFNKKPMMIDFERAKSSQKPRNVSQFCQYICSRFGLDHKVLIPLIKKYKMDYSDRSFREIIKSLGFLLKL